MSVEAEGLVPTDLPWRVRERRGSSNEETRRRNLAAILRSVHYSRAISRAELTRVTGLNKSTIGALVGELADAGLVETSDTAERSGVGRPSPLVKPATDVAALAIHPDIDGVRVALVGLGARILAATRRDLTAAPSPAEAASIVASLAAGLVSGARPGLRVVGAGVAVPALVDHERRIIVDAPHLKWRDELFEARLGQALGRDVHVENDATVGLLAEVHFGAGRGARDIVYLNGSASGIGGSALVGGTLLTGARGFGAEFGHMVIRPGGAACSCGRRGCLETEVNVQRLDAARAPGALAAELDRQAQVLSEAIAELIVVFNPEAVILAGFLGEILGSRTALMRERVDALAYRPVGEGVRLERHELGEDLLLVGAAELGLAALLHDPIASA